jgi:hypothetical protein
VSGVMCSPCVASWANHNGRVALFSFDVNDHH